MKKRTSWESTGKLHYQFHRLRTTTSHLRGRVFEIVGQLKESH